LRHTNINRVSERQRQREAQKKVNTAKKTEHTKPITTALIQKAEREREPDQKRRESQTRNTERAKPEETKQTTRNRQAKQQRYEKSREEDNFFV